MQNNKHPKGLPYLFFTEMWERFGYYLILGIFVLYLIEPEGANGGLGLTDKNAAIFSGPTLRSPISRRFWADFSPTEFWAM